ncbi:MAG: SPOR domain-containing protein [Bacteroidales bacterium]|nr:SPOR domain-containing protein [Bacteroidales bacterium]
MKKDFVLVIILLVIPLLNLAQRGKPKNVLPVEFCVSSDELHLYRLINEYRMTYGFEIIPLSASLSYVAYAHVRDLHENRPDLFGCNLHSWSEKGNWSPCCYAKDPNRTNCMWNKPRELTDYKGNGQELILWENVEISPLSALNQWRIFGPTNDLLLNRDRWKEKSWKAMGVAIYQGYASIWFGEVIDQETSVKLCTGNKMLTSDWLINEYIEESENDADPETEPEEPQITYYLIVGSFKEEAQSKTEVKRLQAGGYADAKVVEKEGNYRISVYDFSDLTEVQKMRRQLDAVFKGVWIMEK